MNSVNRLKKEQGSLLILTIIAVLILSIMVSGLLNVGTTEIYSTRNYHYSKAAYYVAVQGVEEIRARIARNPQYYEAELPPSEAYSPSGSAMLEYHITGSMIDHENMMNGTITSEAGFGGQKGVDLPPPRSWDLASGKGIAGSTVKKVTVTGVVIRNRQKTFSEVICGVFSLEAGY